MSTPVRTSNDPYVPFAPFCVHPKIFSPFIVSTIGHWELCRVGMGHWELCRVGMGHWELCKVGRAIGSCVIFSVSRYLKI